MKHISKILALLLTLALLTSSALAAGALGLAAEAGQGTAALTVTTEAETVAGRLIVTYDPNILTYVSTDTSLEITEETATPGTVTLGYAATDAVQGQLAVLHFTHDVFKDQETQIQTKHVAFDRLGNSTEETAEVTLFLQTTHSHEETCPSKAFVDLDTSRWYHVYTDYVIEQGLMKGLDSTHFAPNAPLTRAQLVTTLYRLAGEPEVTGSSSFSDVPANQYYTQAVVWAEAQGIVKGITPTRFCPSGHVTREQAATFLYRYVTEFLKQSPIQGADLKDFPDGDQVMPYAKTAMSWAVAMELFQGYENGTLRPATELTRVQMAKLLTVLDQTF